MNGLKASISEVNVLKDRLADTSPGCDVMICPPATLVMALADAAAGSVIQTGGQDCHTAGSGAHTGDISPVGRTAIRPVPAPIPVIFQLPC